MGLTGNMSFWESIVAFLIGFTIVFICLIAIALFIIISSKIIGALVKEKLPEVKPVTVTAGSNVSSTKEVVKDNQEEAERLAVIISAISEEMKEPVENFSIVSVQEI